MAENSEEPAKQVRRRGARLALPPGVSGNSGGRPKGSKTFAIKALIAEALSDPGVWNEAIDRYRETLKARKTVINGLEFATRVNREIGLGGAGETRAGVTIIFESNIRPHAPRSKTAMPAPRGERRFVRQLQTHE